MTRSRSLLASLLLLALPFAARAQGTLSTQGFGYPTSQLSTRAMSAAGAIAEFDPFSATNPAAVSNFGSTALYVQIEPEYRHLSNGSGSEHSTIARHPLMVAGFPLSNNLFAGLSVSNLLDRTFETTQRGTSQIGDSTLSSTNFFKSDGAIADVRLSFAWVPVGWLRLGVAAHAITGDNRLQNNQRFDDSSRFAPLLDSSTVTYIGSAVSGGAEIFVGSQIGLAASYRKGGPMSAKHADLTLSKANVPDRVSFSAAYLGIKGTNIAFRRTKETWSRMSGLGSPGLPITDAWDTSVGADVLGPRIGSQFVQLRIGERWRTLPFGLATSDIRERSTSFGIGTIISRGHVGLDFAGVHANRDPVSSSATSLRESAWTMSVGLTVRP